MTTKTHGITTDDLIQVCIILDNVIKQQTKQTDETLDVTIGMPLSRVHAMVISMGIEDLEQLHDLRDRLFSMIPEDRL